MVRHIGIVSLSAGVIGETSVRHEVEIGLAKGKKLYDKRADIAAKDAKREAEREFKIRNF